MARRIYSDGHGSESYELYYSSPGSCMTLRTSYFSSLFWLYIHILSQSLESVSSGMRPGPFARCLNLITGDKALECTLQAGPEFT